MVRLGTRQSLSNKKRNGEKVLRKGEEEGWPAKEAKRTEGHVKTDQEMLSSPESEVLMNAPGAFSDSSSVLEKFRSAS